MFTVNLALAGACEWPNFLGFPLTSPFTTLIFQGEVHLRGMYERASSMLALLKKANDIPNYMTNRIVINETQGHMLSDPRVFYDFQKAIEWMRPDVVFVDPLSDCLTVNENDNAIVGAMLRKLKLLRDIAGSAIVLVHHDGKTNEGTQFRSPRERSRGADVLNAIPDSILSMVPCGRTPGQGPTSKIWPALRSGASVEPFTVLLNEKTLWFERVFGERGDLKMLQKWIGEIRAKEPSGCTKAALLERISKEWGFEDEGRHRAARKYVKQALKKGLITEKEDAGAPFFGVPEPKEEEEGDEE
jgi:hypothetical protein